MSDDLALQMYEAQAELVETRQELERIQRGNDELRNERAANHLMRTVDDFQRNYSNRFETMEDNLRVLTTAVSNNNQTFVEIKETMQVNLNTLSTKVSSSDKILTEISKALRKQNNILEKQNKEIEALKRSIKTMEKKTILLLGGRDGSKMMDSLLFLQNNGDNNGNWKELNIKLPYGVNGHGAQFLNNHLYIFGGKHEKDEILYSSYKLIRGHKWLNNSLKWEKIMDMNQKRTEISNSNVILNDRIWVIGGWNGIEGSLKSVERYDPETNIWTNMKEMNEYRSLAAAAVVNGKIFCCGGGIGEKFSKTTECYDPSSDFWTLISDMPGPNGACGVVVVNAHLIVIGGKAAIGKYFLNSVWVLDTADKDAKWIGKEPRIYFPRCQFSIAKIHDKIFAYGGCSYSRLFGSQSSNDVEIFDGEVWRNGPKLTTSRDSAPVVVVPMEFTQYLN